MRRFQTAMAAFIVTLAAGVTVFFWRSAELHELRKASDARGVAGSGASSGGIAADRQSGRVAVRKSTLLERLNAKLLESVKPEEIATFVHGRDEQVRQRIVTKLNSAEEKEAFRKAFAAYDREWVQAAMNTALSGKERAAALAEISAREKSWIAGQLGPERAAALAEEDAGFEKVRMAQQALSAVARINEVVNLSADQQARLQAAFAERASHPADEPPVEALMIRPYGSVSVERTTPDLQEEAEKVLTPEQWETYSEIRQANDQANGTKMNWMMTRIIPSFLNAMQAAAEGE